MADSPGGREIGRVSVRVLPDTSRFGTDLEKYLRRAEKTLKVQIPTSLDTTGIKADLAKLSAELKTFGAKNKLTITADLDTKGVAAAVKNASAKATAAASKDPVQVKVTATTDDFFKKMRAKAKSLAEDAAIDLPLDADGELLRRKVESLVKEVEKKTSVQVPVDAVQAATARRSVAKIVKDIQDIATKARPAAITATVRADADSFIAQLKKDAERLASTVGPKIPATIDGEKARRELKTLLNQLQETTNVPIPTSIKKTLSLRKDVQKIVDDIEALGKKFNPTIPVASRVAVDEDKLLANLEKVGKRIAEKTELQLPVSPDSNKTKALLRSLVADLEKSVRVAIPVNVQESNDLHAKVKGLVTQIEQIAAAEGASKAVAIPFAADTDAFIRDLRAKADRLAGKASVALPISVDGEHARAQLESLVKRLHDETNIVMPVDVQARVDMRSRAANIVKDIEGIFERATGEVEIDPKVNKTRLGAALRGVKDAFRDLVNGIDDGLGDVGKISNLKKILEQTSLITSRFAAYVLTLGPLFVVAASGALAIAPAIAVALPLVATLGAAVGVVALGWNALFGDKNKGAKGRSGGTFRPLIDDVKTLQGSIGALLTTGLDPLVATLRTTAFPVFAAGMATVATATNGALKEFLKFLSTAATTSAFKALLDGSATAVTGLGHAFTQFSSGLLTLSVAALPGMQLLIDGIQNVAIRFNNFIAEAASSGQLQTFITDAVKATGAFLTSVGGILVRLLSVLNTLRPAAEAVFGAIGDLLGGVLDRLDRFIQNFALNPQAVALVAQLGQGLRQTVTNVFAAIDPLLGSDAMSGFITALVGGLSALLTATKEVGASLTRLAGGLLTVVGIPVINTLTGILNVLTPFAQAIGQSSVAVDLLAAALAVRLIPALADTRVGLAITAVVSAFTAAISAAAGALGSFIFFAKEFGVVATIGNVLTNVGAATATLGGKIKTLIAGALSPMGLAMIGLGTAFTLYEIGTGNINAATEKWTATFGQMVDSVDMMDSGKVQHLRGELQGVIQEGVDMNHAYDGFFGNFFRGVDAITGGPVSEMAGEVTGAAKALTTLDTNSTNLAANLQEVADKTHLTVDQVKAFVKAGDLTGLVKGIADPEAIRAVEKVSSDIAALRTQTGLTLEGMTADVGKAQAAWEQFGAAIQAAQDAAAKAFAGDTNIFTFLKAAKGGKKAKQDVAAVYKTMLSEAKDFSTNIQKVIAKGLDPSVVLQALEAGPAKAGPVLDELVSAHGDRLIKLMNQGVKTLQAQSTRMIEIARLTAIAVNSTTKQVASDFNIAVKISLSSKPGETIQDVAARLKLPEATVRRIGSSVGGEYGLGLIEGAKGFLNGHPVEPKVNKSSWEQFKHTVAATQLHPGINPFVHESAWERFKANVLNFHPTIPLSIAAPAVPAVLHKAAGGLITGPGSYTSDSIPARLSHMEYVQPAHSVMHYGVEVMEALRSHRIPKHLLMSLMNPRAAARLISAAPAPKSSPRASSISVAPVVTGGGNSAPVREHPRTLVLVDHDGVFRGQMRVAAVKSHRHKAQAERLRKLGTWS